MDIIAKVKKILNSKDWGRDWVWEALPVIVEVVREIKSVEGDKEKECEPYKTSLKEISDRYSVVLSPLQEADSQLRGKVMEEYDGTESVKIEGVGELVFPESWSYSVMDFSKVPKELRMEVVDDRKIKAQIKEGIRNIKGIKIEKKRSLRVLTKVD